MKKVLASVLAGSMVLGMASMASAASLVKADKKGDYDFRMVDVYTPDDTFVKYEKYEELVKAKIIPAEVRIAVTEYATDYEAFKKAAKKAGDSAAAYQDAVTKMTTARTKLDAVKTAVAAEGKTLKVEVPTVANLKKELSIGFSSDITTASVKGTAKYAPSFGFGDVSLVDADELEAAVTDAFGTAVGDGLYGIKNNAEFELKDDNDNNWNLYTFGDDDCKEVVVQVPVKKGDNIRVDVNSGDVTVTRKKADSRDGVDYYNLTIKAAAGVRDFELDDFKVEVELKDANIVFFIKGKVAYSDYQVAEPGEVLRADKKSDYTENHEKGCIFKFDEVIDEETRIICNDYVDLLFNGNYGTDFENLRVVDDDIKEVEDFFQDYDIDYYDFVGTPKFAKDITVRVDADSDSYIYEFDKKTGDVVDITDECDYTSDGWTFKRKSLKTYVVLEEPYEGGNVRADKEPVDDEPTEPDDTDATGSKPNPGTGAMPF